MLEMVRGNYLSLLLMILSCVFLLLATEQGVYAQASGVTGAVVDISGALVPGARVEVRCSGTQIGSGFTNERGTFTISGLAAADNCVLRVKSVGFAVFEKKVRLIPDSTTYVKNIRLVVESSNESRPNSPDQQKSGGGNGPSTPEARIADGSISGRVADSAARPIPGVEVAIFDGNGMILGSTVTNESGYYNVERLPSRDVAVRFRASGYKPKYLREHVSPGFQLSPSMALINPATVTGNIIDPQSKPVPGAEVAVIDSKGSVLAYAITGLNGYYTISDLPELNAIVRVRAPGFKEKSIPVHVGSGSTVRMDTQAQSVPLVGPEPRDNPDSESLQSQRVLTPVPLSKKSPVPDRFSSPPETAVFSLDGIRINSQDVSSSERGFQLRGGSDLERTVADGIHNLQERVSSAEHIISFTVWKEHTALFPFQPYSRSYAVLIAIEDYGQDSSFEKLPGAVNQTRALAHALQDQGFEIKEFYGSNASKQKVESYLYYELPKQLGPQDRVLVYFGGHGYTIRNRFGEDLGYLLTYGAKPNSIIENSIPMSRIQTEYAADLAAKHVLFVLDACFAGLAIRESVPSAQDLDRYKSYLEIKNLTDSTARAIFTAGGASDPGVHLNGGGIFTQAFIDGIKGEADANKDGIVTEEELLAYVRPRVTYEASLSGHRQVPQYSALNRYGVGQFVFVPKRSH